MFKQDLNEELIAEIKKYPVLYNTQLQEYKDKPAKNKIWLEIAKKLFKTDDIQTTKKLWKNLRDAFVKNKKAEMKKLPNNTRTNRWCYKAPMEFLTPFISSLATPNTTINAESEDQEIIEPKRKKQKKNNKKEKTPKSPPNKSKNENKKIKIVPQIPVSNGTVISHIKEESENNNNNIVENEIDASFRDYAVLEPQIDVHVDKTPAKKTRGPGKKRKAMTEASNEMNVAAIAPEIDSFFKGISDTVKTLIPFHQVMIQKQVANLVMDYKLKELEHRYMVEPADKYQTDDDIQFH